MSPARSQPEPRTEVRLGARAHTTRTTNQAHAPPSPRSSTRQPRTLRLTRGPYTSKEQRASRPASRVGCCSYSSNSAASGRSSRRSDAAAFIEERHSRRALLVLVSSLSPRMRGVAAATRRQLTPRRTAVSRRIEAIEVASPGRFPAPAVLHNVTRSSRVFGVEANVPSRQVDSEAGERREQRVAGQRAAIATARRSSRGSTHPVARKAARRSTCFSTWKRSSCTTRRRPVARASAIDACIRKAKSVAGGESPATDSAGHLSGLARSASTACAGSLRSASLTTWS